MLLNTFCPKVRSFGLKLARGNSHLGISKLTNGNTPLLALRKKKQHAQIETIVSDKRRGVAIQDGEKVRNFGGVWGIVELL